MYRYKNILVNLNFDEHNEAPIRYTAMITKMARTAKVYFLNVNDSFDIPEAIHNTYPELQPLDEFTQKKMSELVGEHFDGYAKTKILYEAVEGRPLDELLKYIKRKDIDLVISSGRNPKTQSLELAEKLAR
ncbi:universal stress protein, partial [bacterium]|nr:universal stress protein [bacterium]